MAISKSELLSSVVAVDAEVEAHDMEDKQGGVFISENGIYNTTIEKAFLYKTKSKGICCTLLCRGANSIDIDLYIVSFKNKKLITTCKMQGKTVSLPDYKMFKQLFAVATGEVKPLEEIDVEVETIKYKKFGKEVKVQAETVVDLIGKEIQIGIKLKADYAWDKEGGEDGQGAVDKTEYKTDKNGDILYSKELDSVFTTDGFSAEEVITEAEEPKAIESKIKYLQSDKAIYHPKLEESEDVDEETEEEEDELDF